MTDLADVFRFKLRHRIKIHSFMYLLRENKKFQLQNVTTSEYLTQAPNEPLIPSPDLSFLH